MRQDNKKGEEGDSVGKVTGNLGLVAGRQNAEGDKMLRVGGGGGEWGGDRYTSTV